MGGASIFGPRERLASFVGALDVPGKRQYIFLIKFIVT
jgi:hypothetical protein